jgi:hypothetical protein
MLIVTENVVVTFMDVGWFFLTAISTHNTVENHLLPIHSLLA